MANKRAGFSLIAFLIGTQVLAIVAASAITAPPTSSGTNERNAISALRQLVQAQEQFRSIVCMDEDQDGRGEYGSLGELAGVVNLVRNGVGNPKPLVPLLLPAPLRKISVMGFAASSGYLFVVYLPNAATPPVGLRDHAYGGPSAAVDPNHCETLWCAYAWPITWGSTGNRAFFVNQDGLVLQTNMATAQYSGPNVFPPYSAAFIAYGMTSPMALPPGVGCDGNSWIPAQ